MAEVSANGNQRFNVNVSLTITEGSAPRVVRAAAVMPVVAVPAVAVMAGAGAAVVPAVAVAAVAPPPLGAVSRMPAIPAPPAIAPPPLPPATLPEPPPRSPFDFTSSVSAEPARLPAPGRGDVRSPDEPGDGRPGGVWKHLLPLLFLLLGLGFMPLHDRWLDDRTESAPPGFREDLELPVDPKPYVTLHFHDDAGKGEPKEMAAVLTNATMRFGLVMPREHDPKNPKEFKKLTFSKEGVTNNACLRIDGKDYLFGELKGIPAKWVKQAEPLGKDPSGREIDGQKSVWEVEPKKGDRIVVTQVAEIVAGAALPGAKMRRLDTCLVRYEIKNDTEKEYQVGIRFLLDTFIGARDGVPFTIPGQAGLCDTKEAFKTRESVPDFIQVLENDDLSDPGTVARVQFRVGKKLEAPDRVFLGGWPDQSWAKLAKVAGADGPMTRWDVPSLSMRQHKFPTVATPLPADSCVTMYWDERPLKPGETRKVGFAYGLGSVASQESGGKLLLTVGGRMVPEFELTLTALVQNPEPGDNLTLDVPAGMELLRGHGAAEQSVPPLEPGATRKVSTVTWKLQAKRLGEYKLVVKSSKGVKESVTVQIRPRGAFD
jgi:hypothetical protein